MQFWKFDHEAHVRFLNIADRDFRYERVLERHEPECENCRTTVETTDIPKTLHLLNVIDMADGQLKVLSLPSSAVRGILDMYRDQMIHNRMIMSQKAAARRFRYLKMKHRTR